MIGKELIPVSQLIQKWARVGIKMLFVDRGGSIAGGLKLDFDDSTVTGDKYNYCTWGLCSMDKEQWPNKDDHVFPDDFVADGRITVRDDLGCPMDVKCGTEEWYGFGCFHRCRVFIQRAYEKMTKEMALKLFDERIKQHEAEYGRLTTADDGEEWS